MGGLLWFDPHVNLPQQKQTLNRENNFNDSPMDLGVLYFADKPDASCQNMVKTWSKHGQNIGNMDLYGWIPNMANMGWTTINHDDHDVII